MDEANRVLGELTRVQSQGLNPTKWGSSTLVDDGADMFEGFLQQPWNSEAVSRGRHGPEVHQLEAHCGCGAAWFVYVDEDPDDVELACTACGRLVVDVRDLGQHCPAGTDVEPS